MKPTNFFVAIPTFFTLFSSAVHADHVIQWRSDIANTAYVNVTLAKGEPFEAYRIRGLNKGIHTAAKSSPVVLSDGKTFLQAGDTGILYRMDIQTGEPLWAAAQLRISKIGYHGTPCAVYYTDDDDQRRDLAIIGSYDGIIGAFDLETGHRLWETSVGHHIGASPTCTTEFVYIAVEFSYATHPSGGVCKLHIETGEMIWCEYGMQSHSHSSVGVDYEHKVVVAGSNDECLYVYRESDGIKLARYCDLGKIKGSVLMWKGYAIFGSWDFNIYAVDYRHLYVDHDANQVEIETIPKYKWPPIKTGKKHMSGVAIDPETELLYTGGHDDVVRCIDFPTGIVKWEHMTGDYVLSSPVVLQNAILVASSDARLYALDKATGNVQWVFVEGRTGKITSSPDISQDGKYIMFASDSYGFTKKNDCKGEPGSLHVVEIFDEDEDAAREDRGSDEL